MGTEPSGLMPRALKVADLPACIQLDAREAIDPWPESVFYRALGPGYLCSLVRDQAEVVGFCMGRLIVDEYSILNILVARNYRRRGIGRNLLVGLLAQAQEQGAQHAFLEVRESNQAARAVYESLGFNMAGLRPDYYPSTQSGAPREGAVLMAKSLLDE